MQVRTPSAWPRDDGDFTVTHNPGRGNPFTEITLDEDGLLKLIMTSVDDCDRLIKAAVTSRDLLIEHAGDKDQPHAWRATEDNPCLVCGQPRDGHPDPEGGAVDAA